MRCDVVEEMVDAVGDVFLCACRDGGCNGADGCFHGVVNGACIVVENASEFLAVFDLCRPEMEL
jgi:hypothetical protein